MRRRPPKARGMPPEVPEVITERKPEPAKPAPQEDLPDEIRQMLEAAYS